MIFGLLHVAVRGAHTLAPGQSQRGALRGCDTVPLVACSSQAKVFSSFRA